MDQKPTVSFAAPLDGETVTGAVAVRATASDDHGVARVELLAGSALIGTATTTPYEVTWSTSPLVNGNYFLTARATDTADQTAEATIQVFVGNSTGADQPPSVRLIYPVASSKVCGSVTIEAAATDDVGVSQVEFLLDGQSLGVDTSGPFQKGWTTSGAANGPHLLQAVATDTAGQKGQHTVQLRVDNSGGTACDNLPSVSITSPTAQYLSSATVPVTANAGDDVGVVKVQFFVDNGLIAEDAIVPYAATWSTAGFAEGAHTLKAVAYDTANQLGSDVRQVTLDVTPPAVSITSPAASTVVSDAFPVSMNATDAYGVEKVELRVDGMLAGTATATPYTVNVTGAASGSRALRATAYDRAGNSIQSAVVNVTVDSPPVVSFTAPASGAPVKGTVDLAATATDDVGVTQVEFFAGTTSLGVDTTSPYQGSWDTHATPNGGATLKAVATDTRGQTTTAQQTVTVSDQPPSVAITAPVNGGTVKGKVTVSATATDDVAVAQVELFADGTSIGLANRQGASVSFTGGRSGHASVAYNGYLYVLGGYDGTGYSNNVQFAPVGQDGSLGAFTATSSLTGARTSLAAVAYNGYLYVTGGTGTSGMPLNDIQRAQINSNGTLGAFSYANTFSTARYGHASVAYNGYLYVIGGRDGYQVMSDVQVAPINANGSLGSWSLAGNLSEGRCYHTAFASGGHLYVVAGATTGTPTLVPRGNVFSAALNANGTLGSFSTAGALAAPRYRHASAVGGGYVYVIGGCSALPCSVLSDVQVAAVNAGTLGTFTATSSLAGPRSEMSSVIASGHLYVLGGWDGTFGSDRLHSEVQRAQLRAAGALSPFGGAGSGNTYALDWDTKPVTNGSHTLNAVATDSKGQTGSHQISVTVADAAPTVSITAPSAGNVSGSVTISATATDDDVTMPSVTFKAGGVTVGTVSESPYQVTWNTCSVADGAVTLEVIATDSKGQTTTATRSVTVANASAPPSLSGLPGDGTATLSWTFCGVGASGFNLYWATSPGVTTGSTLIASVTSPYVHAGRTNGQSTYYRVAALFGGSPGPLSNEMQVRPSMQICTVDKWCWENPLPQGNTLRGVWGSGANDVWAVGETGTILRWNGSTWTRVPSGTADTLTAVWGSSANDVWAVSSSGNTFHWNGSSWSSVSSPASGEALDAVWGSSANDVWAVGLAGAFRWNGSAWAAAAVAPPTGGLTAVWGSGSNDVWVADTGTSLFRWNGSTWSTHATTASRGFNALWGTGPNDVWAAGLLDIAHWNGSSWSSSPHGQARHNAVWGSSASEVWTATGDMWSSGGSIRRWTGASWAASWSGSRAVYGVWGTSSTNAWAVGEGGIVLRWDGSSWTQASTGTNTSLRGVWASSASDLWAIGGAVEINHSSGSAWSPATSFSAKQGNGLFGFSPTDVWALTSDGPFHWNGTTWTGGGLLTYYWAGWGAAPNDLWAVGDEGAVLRWNGSSWSTVPSGTTNHLRGVWGSGASDVWAVGGRWGAGEVLRWTGTAWSSVLSPASVELYDIWGSGPSDVWAVGSGGTIRHWNGATWSSVASGTMNGLTGVWGSGPSDVWAVGYGGTILRWNGTSWSSMTSGTTNSLTDVWGSGPGDVWVVGELGTILRYRP